MKSSAILWRISREMLRVYRRCFVLQTMAQAQGRFRQTEKVQLRAAWRDGHAKSLSHSETESVSSSLCAKERAGNVLIICACLIC